MRDDMFFCTYSKKAQTYQKIQWHRRYIIIIIIIIIIMIIIIMIILFLYRFSMLNMINCAEQYK